MQQRAINHQPTPFGALLKQWREHRSLSQLDLALTSQVSQRHISFLESGRAQPSQEMVLQLATGLDMTLRHQNLMLSSAGFAPIHTETDLSAPEMASICRAIEFILRQQEPYPAIATGTCSGPTKEPLDCSINQVHVENRSSGPHPQPLSQRARGARKDFKVPLPGRGI